MYKKSWYIYFLFLCLVFLYSSYID